VRAKGKGSGIELSRRDALVCTLRAGKIEKGTYYNNQQQALEAVGLSGVGDVAGERGIDLPSL
jgi:ketosteroid isomerase-like protein